MTIWQHKKTGNLYVKLGEVKNATNGPADGQIMVHYRRCTLGLDAQEFVREKQEFEERFEDMTNRNIFKEVGL